MGDSYTQVSIQFIFAVKYRQALIDSQWKTELYQYITGIVQAKGHKMLCINGMPDHVHVFVGMKPHQSISDLVRDMKSNSSKWINERNFLPVRFQWQNGFGAFSYSASQLHNVVNYILNQEAHHARKTFKEEYFEFLRNFNIAYDEQYALDDLK
ncbi:MAG: IS200/IS605 family transposase [Bacteroidota bacterium]